MSAAKSREVGTSVCHCFVFTFFPTPHLLRPHRTQPSGSTFLSYLGQQQRQKRQQKGGKAEWLLGIHGAYRAPIVRDSSLTVTWQIPGREPQRARRGGDHPKLAGD